MIYEKMNYFSPLTRQIFVASSPQLAALSVGGVIGYPNVILEQLRANDSSIQIDFDTASWIGSLHGLAGVPSILMPTIMQWRGRKFALIISCLLLITGWILTFIASNVTTLITGECFHGLGTNSVAIVSFFSISEMVDPKFRIVSMNLYIVIQTLGITLVCILGRFIYWRTVSLVMCVPTVLALLIGCVWPESPSWLAWKGEFDKCEEAFIWLRGTGEDSKKELNTLLNSQKERERTADRYKRKELSLRSLWLQIKRRDFYLPCFQMFVCLSLFYFSGTVLITLYAMDLIRRATENETAAFYGAIGINIIVFVGSLLNVFLTKIFKNKTLLLFSGGATAFCLVSAFIVTFLQSVGSLPKDSFLCLYCMIGFTISCSIGTISLPFSVSAELVPVKHRDLGGTLYVILTCLMNFVSLKVSPYMMLYLDLWGTFLFFSLNASVCIVYILKYVPETKNRTLQELEDYYDHGHFVKRHNIGDLDGKLPLTNAED